MGSCMILSLFRPVTWAEDPLQFCGELSTWRFKDSPQLQSPSWCQSWCEKRRGPGPGSEEGCCQQGRCISRNLSPSTMARPRDHRPRHGPLPTDHREKSTNQQLQHLHPEVRTEQLRKGSVMEQGGQQMHWTPLQACISKDEMRLETQPREIN